ncbi:Di-copper centre-containing protein [Dothidotthia symphoricarpi CBS 119687]|uniref:Di-copper centre-containing protein n=1 Tax=Dothidotthia symphoricarpi CBS 119687 TaxID=1392245 RepID=A0A6A6A168_9PLEO|nr:Di-copper centre-containing protein [Dothidotthia symphoricarpi CBS 119687]KAF2124904.1 Di-copper centre-containing protein [Dothidotthia symphoricarpi CBS 119687]
MRFSSPLALSLLAGTLSHALPATQDEPTASVTAEATPVSLETPSTDTAVAFDQLEQLSDFAQGQVNASLSEGAKSKRGGCNLSNVAIRREWGSLSKADRKSYTNAVLCLQKKKANTPSALMPGAKTRYDDWVATHINQTLTIHYTGTFLGWHRYFTWQYEQALRNECGYRGYQPYWNWAKTAVTTLEKSSVLDGSDYSMSGNGAYIPNQAGIIIGGNGLPEIPIAAGSGGGCITSGPFVNMTVNLGPVALGIAGGAVVANGNGTTYNPRCLKRDLTDYTNQRFANASSIVNLILNNDNVADFQLNMQGNPAIAEIGVHGGGHYSMGGDPGRDLFTSPGDPLFYLHHGMIDRVWWIWQQLDLETRTGAKGISGTGTFFNNPPSANTTLDTPIDIGYAASPPVTMRDMMSTTEGPLCYVYV